MKILVACEESQAVCKAFREKGHEAYSCDIQECSGGHPEWHIQGDALKILNPKEIYYVDYKKSEHKVRGVEFQTMDGKTYVFAGGWDLIIAHPPCTYLTPAGACNIPKHPERIALGFEAAEFFKKFLDAECDRICVENPPPMKRFGLPKYSQIIQPFYFGDPYNKKTCLWLKGLNELTATNVVEPEAERYKWYSHSLGKEMTLSKWYQQANKNGEWSKNRSKTFQGIANAMAEQWG